MMYWFWWAMWGLGVLTILIQAFIIYRLFTVIVRYGTIVKAIRLYDAKLSRATALDQVRKIWRDSKEMLDGSSHQNALDWDDDYGTSLELNIHDSHKRLKLIEQIKKYGLGNLPANELLDKETLKKNKEEAEQAAAVEELEKKEVEFKKWERK